MLEITTWYRQKTKNSSDYSFNHFTFGHSKSSVPGPDSRYTNYKWAKRHCYLDTEQHPSKVID